GLDSRGRKSISTLNGWGRPDKIDEYDSAGSLLRTLSFTYTAAGRLKSATKTVGSQTSTLNMAWDGAGPATGVSVNGRGQHAQFDSAGRMLSSAEGEGTATSVGTPFVQNQASAHDGRYPQQVQKSERTSGAYQMAMQYNTVGNAVTDRV